MATKMSEQMNEINARAIASEHDNRLRALGDDLTLRIEYMADRSEVCVSVGACKRPLLTLLVGSNAERVEPVRNALLEIDKEFPGAMANLAAAGQSVTSSYISPWIRETDLRREIFGLLVGRPNQSTTRVEKLIKTPDVEQKHPGFWASLVGQKLSKKAITWPLSFLGVESDYLPTEDAECELFWRLARAQSNVELFTGKLLKEVSIEDVMSLPTFLKCAPVHMVRHAVLASSECSGLAEELESTKVEDLRRVLERIFYCRTAEEALMLIRTLKTPLRAGDGFDMSFPASRRLMTAARFMQMCEEADCVPPERFNELTSNDVAEPLQMMVDAAAEGLVAGTEEVLLAMHKIIRDKFELRRFAALWDHARGVLTSAEMGMMLLALYTRNNNRTISGYQWFAIVRDWESGYRTLPVELVLEMTSNPDAIS